MDVQIGPRTEMTEDRSDQGPKWMHTPRTHCVRWGPSSLSAKLGAQPPIFGPYLLWPNVCMDQDTTWYGGRPRPRPLCVRCGPAPTVPQKGRSSYVDAAYSYRPSSVVCRSVCRPVCHTSEPCKNGCTDRAAVWVEDSGGAGEACIR